MTITLDRDKASNARLLTGVGSTSEVIDVALDQLINAQRLRQDLDAYRRQPPTEAEQRMADVPQAADLADDTDWESLFPVGGD